MSDQEQFSACKDQSEYSLTKEWTTHTGKCREFRGELQRTLAGSAHSAIKHTLPREQYVLSYRRESFDCANPTYLTAPLLRCC